MTVYYKYPGEVFSFINAYPNKDDDRGRYVRIDEDAKNSDWSRGTDPQWEVLERGGVELSEQEARVLFRKSGWCKKGAKFTVPVFD